MRSHIKLSILCFYILVNCTDKKKDNTIVKTEPKDCIVAILKQDDSLGTIRNHACETISLSKTIENYVDAVDNLNYEGCPDEFHRAFKSHTSAWSKMGSFAKNYVELRGEMHDLFDSIEQGKDSTAFKPLLKNIFDTWEAVETAKSID